ncbi:hypothetical protein C0Q70_04768 [Pomacea canaliculata]|uniref:Uncharacterized protein n=1 Tax=Pomacea canaliculata TaxID=400727 RepID=A0A2T7PJF5_POMCA|nr:hypothetical protein C0Q70_04768 [Pomacea canaliculata]
MAAINVEACVCETVFHIDWPEDVGGTGRHISQTLSSKTVVPGSPPLTYPPTHSEQEEIDAQRIKPT